MRIQLENSQINIGKPLPWDIFNAEGRCLFRKGFVFRTQDSLNRVSNLQLFYEDGSATQAQGAAKTAADVEPQSRRRQVIYEHASEQDEVDELVDNNIFQFVDYCISDMGVISENITCEETNQLAKIGILIKNIIAVYNAVPDACLGAAHLEYEHPLSSLQPVYTAFICLAMAKALDIPQQNLYSLVGAALTANLSMYKYFDSLVNSSLPLNEEEKAFINQHPELSYKMLRENHVTDETWLTAVLQHHERGDGSGYPKRLQRDMICIEASILASADTYIAMVTPRAYRKSLVPKVAMQQIYKAAAAIDDVISIGLIKQLGIYPPGSLVSLANREIAVVKQRNIDNTILPVVAAIGQLDGHIYEQPIERHTDSPIHKIVDAYQPETPIEVDLNQLWQGKIDITFNTAI